MKLYHFPVAPNPAKVLFYLNEKHISDIELCLVDFTTGAQHEPQHLARSPQGVLPILELEDGTCLGESLAIIEYLEELYPTPAMIGDNPLQRHQARAMERFIEMNVLLRIVRIVHATASPLGLPPNPAVAANEMARLPSALETLDQWVGDGPFVLGERVTIADCTLLAACNFARLGKLDIVHSYDNLDQWFELYALRHLRAPN